MADAGVRDPFAGERGTDEEERGTGRSARGASPAPHRTVAPGAGERETALTDVVEPESIRFSAQFDSAQVLHTSTYADLATTGRTWLSVDVTHDGFELEAMPPLLVDAVWPLENVHWPSLTYDFGAARVATPGFTEGTGWFSVSTEAADAVSAWVAEVVAGTPLAEEGYDPFADEQLRATLKGLHLEGGGSSNLAAHVEECRATLSLRLRSAVSHAGEAGSIRIPAGAGVLVTVEFAGTLADIRAAEDPPVARVTISAPSAVLAIGGEDVARLTSVVVSPGGGVHVTYESMGKLAAAEGVETLGRAFLAGLLIVAKMADNGIVALDDVGEGARFAAQSAIHDWTARQIEEVFEEQVRALVLEYQHAIPGVDLARMLGVDAPSREIVFDPLVIRAAPPR